MVRAVHAIAACAPLCPIASISACKPVELGSSRQWLRVVQSKIVHLNLEVAVRVFESLQESSAETSEPNYEAV